MYKIKNISGSVKEVDVKSNLVKGYFSTFGIKDSDGDIIKNGAYAKTIAESGPNGSNRILHLLQHNPMYPLGKPLKLIEDEHGLYFETAVSDTSYGKDTLKLYRDEVVSEHSVGFQVVKEHYSDEEQANIMTEIKLWEGSTVTWGANQFAQGSLAKNLIPNDKLVERFKQINKAYYSGDYTDETYKLLKQQKEFLESVIYKALQNQKEPSGKDPDTPQNDGYGAVDLDKTFQSFNLQLAFEEI